MSARRQVSKAPKDSRRKWECSICGKVFESEYILNYHRLLEHSESKRPPIGVA
jgi:hypothetical protein